MLYQKLLLFGSLRWRISRSDSLFLGMLGVIFCGPSGRCRLVIPIMLSVLVVRYRTVADSRR